MKSARLHRSLHALLVLGYVLLTVAAVWHAPHFSQTKAAIGSDRHAAHEAVFGNECALCTVKTTPQQSVARFGPLFAATLASAPAAPRLASSPVRRALAARPRAPPALLS